MKKNTIRYAILAIGLSASCLTAHAQTLNFTNSTDNNYILSNTNSENIQENDPNAGTTPTELWQGKYILTGNINTANFDYIDYFKINITGLAGETITSATLNLAMAGEDNQNNEVYEVAVGNFDAGSAAFTDASDLKTQSYTSAGTFTTTGQYTTAPWSIPVNVTSEVQSAINAGDTYVTFQLQNLVTGADYMDDYQTWAFNTNPTVGGGTQDLVIVAAPEPTMVSMLMVSGLVGLCLVAVRRKKQLV